MGQTTTKSPTEYKYLKCFTDSGEYEVDEDNFSIEMGNTSPSSVERAHTSSPHRLKDGNNGRGTGRTVESILTELASSKPSELNEIVLKRRSQTTLMHLEREQEKLRNKLQSSEREKKALKAKVEKLELALQTSSCRQTISSESQTSPLPTSSTSSSPFLTVPSPTVDVPCKTSDTGPQSNSTKQTQLKKEHHITDSFSFLGDNGLSSIDFSSSLLSLTSSVLSIVDINSTVYKAAAINEHAKED